MTAAVSHAQVTMTAPTTQSTTMIALTMGRPPSPGGGGGNNSSGSDTDGIVNSPSSTALRRLYFKSGRNARTRAPTATVTPAAATSAVPKVVVMGSSSTASTSETTINTSTESASTLITNVTATDTSETFDSLDMGETSGQSEPLLSSSLDEPPQTALAFPNEQTVTEMELIGYSKINKDPLLNQKEESAESSLTTTVAPSTSHTNNMPRTAPVTSSVHFPFDPPPSPKSVRTTEKSQNLFTFDDAAILLEQKKYQKGKEVNQDQQLQDKMKWTQQQDKIEKKYGRSGSLSADIRTNEIESVHSKEPDKNKENKKRKDSVTMANSSSKTNGFSYPKQPVKDNSLELEDAKKQKRDVKLKSKSNRYSSVKTSPRKEKYSGGKIRSAPAVQNKEKFYGSQKHTYDKKDLTMFPFDREAIDYERIQRECFEVEEDPEFPYDVDSDSDTDSDDLSVYERKTYSSPSKSSRADIFQQYALLSQKETKHSHERRSTKRNRPDLIHSRYDHIAKADAFSPKVAETPAAKPSGELHKFDQIASKFDQIAPNYHQLHGSNTNLQSSSIATSMGPTSTSGGTRSTPPLPDFRVDFFAEHAAAFSMHHHPLSHQLHHQYHQLQQQTQQSGQQHSQNHHPNMTPLLSNAASQAQQQASQQQSSSHLVDTLEDCQKLSQNTGAINVTANPLEAAVCTQPRATIVVQQPSLSLDNTVETLLLKNEGDFISVEQAKESRKKKQQREDNMRQLLDVTNTLTSEELRDFEMRYGSPHHCRSQSVKTPGSRASGRPNQLSLPQQRSRVASMPNTGVEEEYYRLRHFSITGKGVVNRGDSLKSRRSRSNNSVASSNSSTEHLTANQVPVVGSARTSATCSLASSRESSTSNPGNGPYRVLMLGDAAVGKSSLVSQFMTSEYLHAYDTSIDDDSGEKSVSVLLSGEESELVFIDHAYADMTPENCLSSYDPHGYCVIYSSADRGSFMLAERILQTLWTTENIAQKAVILVGNKADLARSRVVTSDEGKAMATAYDCKFIETSVGINHNVDELLVGLLTQIRLKLENPEKSRDLFRKRSCRKSKRRACSPLGVAATACLTGNGGTNPSTPMGPPTNLISEFNTPPGSAHSSPRKYRGSRTSASLKVKGLLGRVWARDSKSKSCENLHVL
ncbi:uncharacterized protein LOC119647289 isoform X2 [Hermetia illucens]|uniref:uncharacterized protein LOC119647289 isoform X2 n=1 Tax=Hermetia illucens TaxID=343691 RepID=UPI0018CC3D79|nr:uncharacterized protein LOC119647289 isoform X2 [Hermetia illucens]